MYDGAAAVQHQQDGDGGRLGRAVSLTMIGPQHTVHTAHFAVSQAIQYLTPFKAKRYHNGTFFASLFYTLRLLISLLAHCALCGTDFAHVWSAEGRLDENYSRGVRSLISLCGRFTAV